jgi:predicted PhzF superfamily epimerase YddE/YHI9
MGRSVAWESVFIIPSADGRNVHQLRFFMPNGNEVSMCAHAAIGAAWFLGSKSSGSQIFLSTQDGLLSATATDAGARIFLHSRLSESSPLDAADRAACASACSLSIEDLCGDELPNLTSSVARPKTLIAIRTADRLHSATPVIATKDRTDDDITGWLQLCDRLGSTGLYLYHLSKDHGENDADEMLRAGSVIEARQFPRSSG